MLVKLQEELEGKNFIMLKYDEGRKENKYTIVIDKIFKKFTMPINRSQSPRGTSDNIMELYIELTSSISFYNDEKQELVHLFNKLVEKYKQENTKKVIIMTTYIDESSIYKILVINMDLHSNECNKYAFDNLEEVIDVINDNYPIEEILVRDSIKGANKE